MLTIRLIHFVSNVTHSPPTQEKLETAISMTIILQLKGAKRTESGTMEEISETKFATVHPTHLSKNKEELIVEFTLRINRLSNRVGVTIAQLYLFVI